MFTRYANVTEEQKSEMVNRFAEARRFNCPTGQSVSIAAHDTFHLTDRQWSGKAGTDAFAATLATLVMLDIINITDKYGG